MISIIDKTQCCGCRACEQRCPKHCITMKEDNEGFLYPEVDEKTCLKCGLCDKVCPVQNQFDSKDASNVYAAKNLNETIRRDSSSGGIFSILAEHILAQRGVVFGARYNDEWQVEIDYIESIDDLPKFRGSKYVQASTGKSFSLCESFLKQKRMVLFTGTPCQISGLKHFLKTDYENLLTCDIVCHGSPSPKVWNRYLNEEVHGNLNIISNIKFRDKAYGWKNFHFTIEGKNNTTIVSSFHRENRFMQAFLSNLILRPSCYNCPAKEGKSCSDFTLADFWGVDSHHPQMDDDLGTSLLLVNSPRGEFLIKKKQIQVEKSDIKFALSRNPGLAAQAAKHNNREIFFSKLENTLSVKKLIWQCTKPSLAKRIKRFVHKHICF